jgi:hypothetical protein
VKSHAALYILQEVSMHRKTTMDLHSVGSPITLVNIVWGRHTDPEKHESLALLDIANMIQWTDYA